MLKEICRKIGLPKVGYKLRRKALLKENPLMLTEQEALDTLEAFSPDPNQSSIAPKKLGDSYDLEIIVPAYNVEKYIEGCIESILSQKTSFRYHTTFIDDGSTDATGRILDSYGHLKDVLVIHQANKGFSGARNSGIDASNGRYLMFVDSDDTIPPNAVQDLLSCAFETDADVVEGGHILTTKNGHAYRSMRHKGGRIESRKDLEGYAWAKVMKKELFERVSFPLKYLYEDSIMSQIIYPLSKSIYGIDGFVYSYRRNPLGISRGGSNRKQTIDSFWITRKLYEDRSLLGLEKNQDYYEYILSMAKLTCQRTESMPEAIKKAIFIAYVGFIDREFGGYKTNTKPDLEYALRNRKYSMYKWYCRT